MEIEFWKTGYGRRYYENDIPKIANSLESISRSLEKIVLLIEKNMEKKNDTNRNGNRNETLF